MMVLNNRRQIIKRVLMLPEKKAMVLPKKYLNFADVFSKINVDIFLEHLIHNLAIEIKKKKVPFFGLVYNHLEIELQILQNYINKILVKGFKTLSKFSFRASVLFTKKNDSLYLCIDY